MTGPFRDSRRGALRRLRRRDVLTTREGWVVDLAGQQRIDAVRALAGDESADVERALVDALADPLDEVRAEVVATLESRRSAAGAARCAATAAGWDHQRFPLSRARAWEFLHACASADDAVPLTEALLRAETASTVDPRALDALERSVDDAADLRDEVLARVLRCLDDDPGVTARARQLAVRLAAAAPAAVVAVLGDDRRAAIAAAVLGEIGDLDVAPDLGSLLSPARPTPVRAAGAAALGTLGGVRAARVLAGYVDDPDPTVRRAATDAFTPLSGLLTLPRDLDTPPPDTETEQPAPAAGQELEVASEPDAESQPTDAPEGYAGGPALVEAPPLEDEQPVRDTTHEPPNREPVIVSRPVEMPVRRSIRPRSAAAGQLVASTEDAPAVAYAEVAEQLPEVVSEPATRNGAAHVTAAAAEDEAQATVEATQIEDQVAELIEPVPDVSPDIVSVNDGDAPSLTSDDTHGPTELEASDDVVPLDADPDAPWNRPHGPVPADPPPRPRGAKRPRRRR